MTAPPAAFAPQALRDLRAASSWLHARSPRSAGGLRNAVAVAARLLGEHPEAGPERPDLAPKPLRFLALRRHPYLIVYSVQADGRPRILRVLHAARDIPGVFGSGLD